jgi:hypothetical protein
LFLFKLVSLKGQRGAPNRGGGVVRGLHHRDIAGGLTTLEPEGIEGKGFVRYPDYFQDDISMDKLKNEEKNNECTKR